MEKEEKVRGLEMKIIARIHTALPTKFGVPRQSGLVDEFEATVVFEPEYRNADAVRGLEEYSHIWLIWQFSEAVKDTWSPTVRPPRLGGNTRMGVFATRSPFRPNALGLSSVKLTRITMDPKLGPVLHVRGADMMDNTPVFDIKPYLAYGDSHPEATGGFTDHVAERKLSVVIPPDLLEAIPKDQRETLRGLLAHDPRPSYQNDPQRVYGMRFGDFDVRFLVAEGVLTVCEVTKIS